jgi:hypothetical protein
LRHDGHRPARSASRSPAVRLMASADLYLDLVKHSLTGGLHVEAYELHPGYFGADRRLAWVTISGTRRTRPSR